MYGQKHLWCGLAFLIFSLDSFEFEVLQTMYILPHMGMSNKGTYCSSVDMNTAGEWDTNMQCTHTHTHTRDSWVLCYKMADCLGKGLGLRVGFRGLIYDVPFYNYVSGTLTYQCQYSRHSLMKKKDNDYCLECIPIPTLTARIITPCTLGVGGGWRRGYLEIILERTVSQ